MGEEWKAGPSCRLGREGKGEREVERAGRSRASGPRGVERVEVGLAGRWAGCEAESLAGRAGRWAERVRVDRGGSGRGGSGLLH